MCRYLLLLIWVLPCVLLAHGLFPSPAGAEGINFRSEFQSSSIESESSNKATGTVTSSQFSVFNQRYNIDLLKRLYPYLTVNGGTLYELDSSTSTSQDTETETEVSTTRPFIRLSLNNPFYRAGVSFRKSQIDRDVTGIPTTQDSRDNMNLSLGLRPAGLPVLNLLYDQSHTYNNPRTQDSINTRLSFDTRYSVWKRIGLNYSYSRAESADGIRDFETLRQRHNGRIDYSHQFFNRRVTLSTGYRIRYRTFEFPGIGSAAESAVVREHGLFAADSTPGDGALGIEGSLIDGNTNASSGIDIGENGNQTDLPNMGLEFGSPINVNKIHIWVDRTLSSAVAGAFSWSVYTSPDNIDTSTWTPHATGITGTFGVFENRFEITFPGVTTQYIKVVTTPLVPGTPGTTGVQSIFVTELQAFTTIAGESIVNEETTIEHDYNLNLTGMISDKTSVGYSLGYRLNEQDPSAEKSTELSNQVYLNHRFNKVFSLNTNVSQTQDQTNDTESSNISYGSSLTADYLETFSQTLSYSGSKSRDEQGSSGSDSINLRNNATLYRGWSAFFDAGWNRNDSADATQRTSTIIRTGTDVSPHRMVALNLQYSVSTTSQQETTSGNRSSSRWSLQASLTPFRALSLSTNLTMEETGDSKTSLQSYSVNWAPFPEGTLQVALNYSETLRPEDNRKSSSMGPNISWSVSRHISLRINYNISQSDSELQTADSSVLNANLRLVF